MHIPDFQTPQDLDRAGWVDTRLHDEHLSSPTIVTYLYDLPCTEISGEFLNRLVQTSWETTRCLGGPLVQTSCLVPVFGRTIGTELCPTEAIKIFTRGPTSGEPRTVFSALTGLSPNSEESFQTNLIGILCVFHINTQCNIFGHNSIIR